MNNYKRKWNFKSILTILVVSGTIGTLNAQQDRRTEYPDFSYGEGVENNEWIQAIKVIAAPMSKVKSTYLSKQKE